MHRYVLIMMLSMSVLISGCSTKTIPLTPYFDNCGRTVTLAKSVTNGNASYSVDSVSTDDPEIFAYISCSNLSGYHTLRWDWYSPKDNLYLSKSKTLSTSSGRFSENASAWHALKIRGDKAEKMPGAWKIKVFVDNRLISSSSFYITSTNKEKMEEIPLQPMKTPVVDPFNDGPLPTAPTSGIKTKK